MIIKTVTATSLFALLIGINPVFSISPEEYEQHHGALMAQGVITAADTDTDTDTDADAADLSSSSPAPSSAPTVESTSASSEYAWWNPLRFFGFGASAIPESTSSSTDVMPSLEAASANTSHAWGIALTPDDLAAEQQAIVASQPDVSESMAGWLDVKGRKHPETAGDFVPTQVSTIDASGKQFNFYENHEYTIYTVSGSFEESFTIAQTKLQGKEAVAFINELQTRNQKFIVAEIAYHMAETEVLEKYSVRRIVALLN